ncbi:unnamed protein product [Allacma fusca]|uniref:Uncharacterized protein n=1 Tax=Allacma fusca TaxID=39272 RepID=A0A8J2KV23_9HEXA|nr:unnamed protein product [Allacma fusca]
MDRGPEQCQVPTTPCIAADQLLNDQQVEDILNQNGITTGVKLPTRRTNCLPFFNKSPRRVRYGCIRLNRNYCASQSRRCLVPAHVQQSSSFLKQGPNNITTQVVPATTNQDLYQTKTEFRCLVDENIKTYPDLVTGKISSLCIPSINDTNIRVEELQSKNKVLQDQVDRQSQEILQLKSQTQDLRWQLVLKAEECDKIREDFRDIQDWEDTTNDGLYKTISLLEKHIAENEELMRELQTREMKDQSCQYTPCGMDHDDPEFFPANGTSQDVDDSQQGFAHSRLSSHNKLKLISAAIRTVASVTNWAKKPKEKLMFSTIFKNCGDNFPLEKCKIRDTVNNFVRAYLRKKKSRETLENIKSDKDTYIGVLEEIQKTFMMKGILSENSMKIWMTQAGLVGYFDSPPWTLITIQEYLRGIRITN